MPVKVVFLETVEGSGSMGEVRDVANGYARNYLLPRGFAAPATPSLLRRAATLATQEEVRQQSQDEHAEGLVSKLDGETLVMAVRVGEQGRLYGSVTSADIAEKAGEILGEELDRRRVLLPQVIRKVGVFSVPLRLSRNIVQEVQVVVVDAEAPEGVEAAAEKMLTLDETAAEASAAAGFADGAPEPGMYKEQSLVEQALARDAAQAARDAGDDPSDGAPPDGDEERSEVVDGDSDDAAAPADDSDDTPESSSS